MVRWNNFLKRKKVTVRARKTWQLLFSVNFQDNRSLTANTVSYNNSHRQIVFNRNSLKNKFLQARLRTNCLLQFGQIITIFLTPFGSNTFVLHFGHRKARNGFFSVFLNKTVTWCICRSLTPQIICIRNVIAHTKLILIIRGKRNSFTSNLKKNSK